MAGRYRLRSQLGGGGMGAVWLARDELLGRDVAVKQVLVPIGIDEALAQANRDAAMREGRIAARLSHPHAVGVYDMVLDAGQPWLVMEYLPSVSLAALLHERGILPIPQVAQIGAQVADALTATHAAGVVHRDVKPGNILIGEGPGRDGLVKITDFGISRAVGDVSLTQTGVVKGTPAFLAPEVAQGSPPDEASDVFSLGATLYACLEGTPPFGLSENALQMLHKVAGGDFQPPRQAGSLTSPLMHMLAADPAERPSMPQVRDQLAKLAAGPDKDVTEVLTARTLLPRTLPGMPARVPTTSERTPIAPPTPAPATAAPVPAEPTSRQSRPAAPPPTGVSAGAAAPAAAQPVASPPATPPPAGPGSRRRRWLTAVIALLVLGVAATLLVVNLNRPDAGEEIDRDPTAASTPPVSASSEPSTPPETPAASTEPTPTETPTETTTETTTETPTPTSEEPDGPPTAAEMQQFVTDYYALLPDQAEAAYERTGPRLRAASSLGDYLAFWGGIRSVTLGRVSAQDGDLTVTAPVEFVRDDGSVSPEQHTIELAQGEDGQLLINWDQPG